MLDPLLSNSCAYECCQGYQQMQRGNARTRHDCIRKSKQQRCWQLLSAVGTEHRADIRASWTGLMAAQAGGSGGGGIQKKGSALLLSYPVDGMHRQDTQAGMHATTDMYGEWYGQGVAFITPPTCCFLRLQSRNHVNMVRIERFTAAGKVHVRAPSCRQQAR
jgi:hypothetical protein